MKIVINRCFGGFGLSAAATLEFWRRGALEGTPIDEYFGVVRGRSPDEPLGKNQALSRWRKHLASGAPESDLFQTVFTPDESMVLYAGRMEEDRANPALVASVEEMGEKANGRCASLKVIEVPDDAEWEISEYDGNEHVAEKHRTWG